MGTPAPTVKDALSAFYARERLPDDGGGGARRWTISLGPASITLPNFKWRARALPVHDLHHLLTGYACTPTGEFEMAAWEFAAGRYPDACATAFCLPLVGMGAALRPRRTFRAFMRGRASRTLYAQGLTDEVLRGDFNRMRSALLPEIVPEPRVQDALAYMALVLASTAWMAAPFAAFALAIHLT